jgi:protein involved in polysaccharide export with SLBB domain
MLTQFLAAALTLSAVAADPTFAGPVPFEGSRPLPPYRVQPPDVLCFTAEHLVPRSGCRQDAQGSAPVDHLRAGQEINGNHLVRPDGTVGLGAYGCVPVAGLTAEAIKARVESHLSRWFDRPRVCVKVTAYNSRFYYVIIDGGGYGQQVLAFPATGNETVLDAIGQANGPASPLAFIRDIQVARPAVGGKGPEQIRPVDWTAITRDADPATNYPLQAGDRVIVRLKRRPASPCARVQLSASAEVVCRLLGPTWAVLWDVVMGDYVRQMLTRDEPGCLN